MQDFLNILPLIVILVALLPPFRAHILIAGLIGGVVAVIVGGMEFAKVTGVFFGGLKQILGIGSVMMFAATAMVLAKAGSSLALINMIKRVFKDKLEFVAAGMVLVQALATYAAGLGAANTLVIAPLVFLTVGFVPLVIAGMSIVSGASWATSPASAETAYISEQMGITAGDYSAFMRPYTIVFWVIGVLLAWWGVRRWRLAGKLKIPVGDETAAALAATGPGEKEAGAQTEVADWRKALPFLILLLIILIGPVLNRWVGVPLFTPLLTPIWVLAVASVSMKLRVNQIGELFINGGLTILRYLFLVGLFLGFIKLLAEIGTFASIAKLVEVVPVAVIAVAALVVSFLVAIPSAAYTVAIDALIIPVLAAVGVPIWAFGFVGIAVAQGAMISPVQINVSATAHGFRTDIMKVIRTNIPYMPVMLIITIILAMLVQLLQ